MGAATMAPHHFRFSTNWQGGKRLCGDCGKAYDSGEHVEVRVLKPYTQYVCSIVSDGSLGHSSVWSGAQDVPELRSARDAFCMCGAPYVEQDKETWRLSWEMDTGHGWRPVSKVASRYETHSQHVGLLRLIEDGELIRNVQLVQLDEVSR